MPRGEELGTLHGDESRKLHEGELEAAVETMDWDFAERDEFKQGQEERDRLVRREAQRRAREQAETARLAEMLQKWSVGCQLCHALGVSDAETHSLVECTRPERARACRTAAHLAKVVWEKYSCCFHCGAPQSMCASYRQRPDAGWEKVRGKACQWQGAVVAGVAAMWAAGRANFVTWAAAQMPAGKSLANSDI
jgi:hypothetical protein